MGFRNPITTAAAVDTRAGAGAAGARLYQQDSPGGIGTQGVLEFDDGLADTPATLTSTPGSQRSVTGGTVELNGGSFSGHTNGKLDLTVVDPGSGLQSQAKLTADVVQFVAGGVTVTAEDTGWQTLTPAGGWNNVNTTVKVRRINGVSYLALGAYNATAWPAGSVIATLPTGYAPTTQVNLLGDWAGQAREINVYPNGNVAINAAQGGGSGVVGSGSWPVN